MGDNHMSTGALPEVALKAADQARREAMISGDTDTLAQLLSDDLIWTHSSGKTDSKASFLESIGSGVVQYKSLEVSNETISRYGDLFIFHGRLNGQASRNGVVKELKSRFLSVWRKDGDAYQMLAWQSTGCS